MERRYVRSGLCEQITRLVDAMPDKATLFPGGWGHGMPDQSVIDANQDPMQPYGYFELPDSFGLDGVDTGSEVIEVVPVTIHAYATNIENSGGDKLVDVMTEAVHSLLITSARKREIYWEGCLVSEARQSNRMAPTQDPDKTRAGEIVWHAAIQIEFTVTVTR